MPKSSPPKSTRRWSPISRSSSRSPPTPKAAPPAEYSEQPSHHPSTLPKPLPYSATTPTSYNPLSSWSYIPPNSTSTFSCSSTYLPNPSAYALTTRLPRLLTPSSQYSQQSLHLPPIQLPPQNYSLPPHLNRRFNLNIYHKKTNRLSTEYKELTTTLLNSEQNILLSTPNLPPSYLALIENRIDDAGKALSRAHDILFLSINSFPYSFFGRYGEGERDEEVEEVLKDLWAVKNCVMKEIRAYIKLKSKRTTREEIWCGGLVAGGGLEILGMAEEAGKDMERVLRKLGGGDSKMERERSAATKRMEWNGGEYQHGFIQVGGEFDPASYGYGRSYDALEMGGMQYHHVPFQMDPDISMFNAIGTGSVLDLTVDFNDYPLPPDPFIQTSEITPPYDPITELEIVSLPPNPFIQTSEIPPPYNPITELETAMPDYSNHHGNEINMSADMQFTIGELEAVDNILTHLDFDSDSSKLVEPAISTRTADPATDGPIGTSQPVINETELEFNFDDFLHPDSSDSEPESTSLSAIFRSDPEVSSEAAPKLTDSPPCSSSPSSSESVLPINTCFDETEDYGTFTTESVELEVQQDGCKEAGVYPEGFDPLFDELEDFWEISGSDGYLLLAE